MRASLCLVASTLLAISALAGENCKITNVKTSSLDAKAIGLSAQSATVLLAIVTVTTDGAAPVLLKWKDAVPTIGTEERKVKATRLLIPNWLPMAGGVGPYATEMGVGGDEIGGWAKIDENTWAGWLAVDKPGGTIGDHISVPVGSVTVTVKKEKPVVLKFLFAESPPLKNAVLTIPGCTPSPCQLSVPSEPKAHGANARPQSLPEEKALQKLIADACLADRPSLQGYTGIIKVKETKAHDANPQKFLVYADATFVYFGTALSLGYIDHFVLSQNPKGEWEVEIVKKEQK
jgi:hypothetical protein